MTATAADITTAILATTPGTLVSESAVRRATGAHLGTIRKAIRLLEAEGLLVAHSTGGRFGAEGLTVR